MLKKLYIVCLGIVLVVPFTTSSKTLIQPISSADYLLLEQTYIVELRAASAVEKQQLSLNNHTANKFTYHSNQVQKIQTEILQQQQVVIKDFSDTLQKHINIQRQFHTAYNGFVVKLTSAEVDLIRSHHQVKAIHLDQLQSITTDRGPVFIGAASVWDGISGNFAAKGEGIIVAVIDSGIRAAHPSFAEVSPSDGYQHINPLGNNNFLGYCSTTPGYCNNKLIGAYNYVDGDTTPNDLTGHGVHVASIAVGNRINFGLGGNNSMQLSGVAPRANLIVYRTANDEGNSTTTAVITAIEQAIADGVDIINYSSGSPASDPWENSISVAFRNARAAGIFVAAAAGNSGPNPSTTRSPSNAAWITSVAASSHDRTGFPTKDIINLTGGNTPPADINGRSLTGEITAPIVYAGGFNNGDTNPEQCLSPFPAGTFSGEIVVCDRGEIARVQKAKHVAAGGAGGYVLANVSGGATFLADDIYVIPGIHINATDGDALKSWLNSGDGHMATITGTSGPVETNPVAGDIIAEFSSRGPNLNFSSYLKPSVAAPGVNILAAGIGEVDWTFNQGTSMASPHVAGAAALIKQLHPDWTPADIHSAIVTTANTNLTKDFGINDANAFDMGGGRIDVSQAVNAGLSLDETITNFIAADPKNSGNPGQLNLPGLTDLNCNTQCSWSRTLTAKADSSWTVQSNTDPELNLVVEPNSFSLNQGDTQLISVTANIDGDNGDNVFGQLAFTPADTNLATTHLPLAVQINNSNLKQTVSVNTSRDSGQFLIEDIETIEVNNLAGQVFLQQTTPQQLSLAADSDNSSAFDDLNDGVNFEIINIEDNTQLLYAQISNATAQDLDLFVGRDRNLDGQPQESEILASSTSPSFTEEVFLLQPEAGNYWILVQNWQGSDPGPDTYTARLGSVNSTDNSDLSISVPSSSNASTPFDISVNFQNASGINQRYIGAIALSRPSKIGDIAMVPLVINRQSNDVSITTDSNSVEIDDSVEVSVNISPSANGVSNYTTTLTIPDGLQVVSNSIDNADASLANNQITWNPSINANGASYSFSAQFAPNLEGQTITLTIEHNVDLPNAQMETSNTSFNITAINSGTQSNSSSGGGSLLWLLALYILVIPLSRKKTLRLDKH